MSAPPAGGQGPSDFLHYSFTWDDMVVVRRGKEVYDWGHEKLTCINLGVSITILIKGALIAPTYLTIPRLEPHSVFHRCLFEKTEWACLLNAAAVINPPGVSSKVDKVLPPRVCRHFAHYRSRNSLLLLQVASFRGSRAGRRALSQFHTIILITT
jgi:hypothetical protein